MKTVALFLSEVGESTFLSCQQLFHVFAFLLGTIKFLNICMFMFIDLKCSCCSTPFTAYFQSFHSESAV
jgi:hypothetical protein